MMDKLGPMSEEPQPDQDQAVTAALGGLEDSGGLGLAEQATALEAFHDQLARALGVESGD
ncbi:hypothetical protein GCM10028789_08980 [Sinomonas halotolerans]